MEVVSTSSVFRVTLRVRREDLRESHERSRLLPPRSTAEWGCTVAVLLGETASPFFRIKRSFGCDGYPSPGFVCNPKVVRPPVAPPDLLPGGLRARALQACSGDPPGFSSDRGPQPCAPSLERRSCPASSRRCPPSRRGLTRAGTRDSWSIPRTKNSFTRGLR